MHIFPRLNRFILLICHSPFPVDKFNVWLQCDFWSRNFIRDAITQCHIHAPHFMTVFKQKPKPNRDKNMIREESAREKKCTSAYAHEKIKWCKFMTFIFMKFLLSTEYKEWVECFSHPFSDPYFVLCMCLSWQRAEFFTFYLSNINKWNRWKRGSEFNSSQTKPKYCSFYFSLVWLPPFLPANSLYISFARNVSNSLNHKGSSHLAWKRFSFMMQILCCVKSSALSLCWMDRRGGGGGSFKAITKFHWIKPSSEWVKYSH